MTDNVRPPPTFESQPSLGTGASGADADLTCLYQRGVSAWPGIPLSLRAFANHLQKIEPLAADRSGISELNAAGIYFAAACAAEEPLALKALDTLLSTQLSKYVRQFKLPDADLAELKQILWLKLLGSKLEEDGCIFSYSGKGAFESYVRVVAVRQALDMIRARARLKEVNESVRPSLTDSKDFELDYVKERYRAPIARALETTLTQLDHNDRLLLRLYFLEQMSIDRLAKVLDIHRSSVARRIHELRQRIAKQIQAELCEQCGLAQDEAIELMALVQSRLDMNVSLLLQSLE